MCRNANIPLPGGGEGPAFTRVCDKAGNLPACQLCPQSGTYWQNEDRAPDRDFYDGTRRRKDPNVYQPLPDLNGLLTTDDGWNRVCWPPEPCVVCTKPAMLFSPRGKPCHKTCAEKWARRRTTPPASATAPT